MLQFLAARLCCIVHFSLNSLSDVRVCLFFFLLLSFSPSSCAFATSIFDLRRFHLARRVEREMSVLVVSE